MNEYKYEFVLANGWVSMNGLLVYNLDSLVEKTQVVNNFKYSAQFEKEPVVRKRWKIQCTQ